MTKDESDEIKRKYEKFKEMYNVRTEREFQNRLEKTAYYRKYNVEYELGNGICHTFSNVLIAVNGNHLYFESEENGLDIIRTDRIVSMTCIGRERKLEVV